MASPVKWQTRRCSYMVKEKKTVIIPKMWRGGGVACKRRSRVFCGTCWINVSSLQRTRRGTEAELSFLFCLGCVRLLLVGIAVPCFRTLLSPVVSSHLAVLLALINMTSPKPCIVLKDVVFMNVRVLRTTSASLASFY